MISFETFYNIWWFQCRVHLFRYVQVYFVSRTWNWTSTTTFRAEPVQRHYRASNAPAVIQFSSSSLTSAWNKVRLSPLADKTRLRKSFHPFPFFARIPWSCNKHDFSFRRVCLPWKLGARSLFASVINLLIDTRFNGRTGTFSISAEILSISRVTNCVKQVFRHSSRKSTFSCVIRGVGIR